MEKDRGKRKEEASLCIAGRRRMGRMLKRKMVERNKLICRLLVFVRTIPYQPGTAVLVTFLGMMVTGQS